MVSTQHCVASTVGRKRSKQCVNREQRVFETRDFSDQISFVTAGFFSSTHSFLVMTTQIEKLINNLAFSYLLRLISRFSRMETPPILENRTKKRVSRGRRSSILMKPDDASPTVISAPINDSIQGKTAKEQVVFFSYYQAV